jgi:prevent-host-death family protein
MKVISSAELRSNLKKYLDRARTETIVIQRGRSETFVLTRQDDLPEDYHRAISMDEAIVRAETGMREIIARRKRSAGAM